MVKQSDRKTMYLDDSILFYNPESPLSFTNNKVVIPTLALDRLEEVAQKKASELSLSAKEALKLIDSLILGGNIQEGVKLPNGGRLFLDNGMGPLYFSENTNTNRLLSNACEYAKKNANERLIFVSKYPSSRIKATALNLTAQDYQTGRTSLFEKYGKIIAEKNYNNGITSVRYQRRDNDIFRISGTNNSTMIRRRDSIFNLTPENDEQECAIDALTCPDVSIIALTGCAGSGKTLLSLAAGLHQTNKAGKLFRQVIIGRPTITLGGEFSNMGFLPGTAEEKMQPWTGPIFDNLEVLIAHHKDSGGCKEKNVAASQYAPSNYLFEKGILRIEPLAYIRGRSLPLRYFIVDEAQNLRPIDIKTLITRCGRGTKIIFTGDMTQIDTPFLDAYSNGLAHLISQYINEPEFCYFNFSKSARSEMADKAARLL